MAAGSKTLIAACGMSKKARSDLGMRQVPSLGLWTCDRGGWSCNRTRGCSDCYNRKTIETYKETRKAWSKGGRDDRDWNKLTSASFAGLYRVRLCTRGEAFTCRADVLRVAGWIRDNPKTLFWIPTRAWTTGMKHGVDLEMMDLIEREIMSLPNARIMASVDPWTAVHYPLLIARGWSTMYFESYAVPEGFVRGVHPAEGLKGARVVKCKKTFGVYISDNRVRFPKAICRRCAGGCFDASRVDVWLLNHAKALSHDVVRAVQAGYRLQLEAWCSGRLWLVPGGNVPE